MKKYTFILAFSLTLLTTSLKAQNNDSTKYEFGLIHYDLRESKIDTYFGEVKKEYPTNKDTYFLTILNLLNELGQRGWEIKSSDSYQSLKWGSTPTNAMIIYVSRKVN